MNSRFLTAVLILLLAVTAQFYLRMVFGIYFNFVLVALVASALLLTLPELIILILLAIFILNWQPGFGFDLLVLGALPLAAFYISRLIKWKSWPGSIITILAATLIFYAITQPLYILMTPVVLFEEVIGILAAGTIISLILSISAEY